MISFDFPLFFLLVPIIFGIWYFFDVKKYWQPKPNPIIAKFSIIPKWRKIYLLLRFFAIIILCMILGNGTFSINITKKIPEKNTIMIVFDISRSMLAEDISPNRMAVAKNTIKSFITERKNDKLSLIIFSGKAFLVVAPSTDRAWIEAFVNNITPEYILQEKPWLSGTNIGDALLLAKIELDKITGKKNIILMTDGSANVGSDPEKAASEIAKSQIPIYTIGIGKKDNNPLTYTDLNGQKNFFYDANGEKIIGDLDDELLQKIAIMTGWKYYSAENISDLQNAFNETNANISNNEIEETKLQKFSLTPILLFLFFGALWLESIQRRKFLEKYQLLGSAKK